MWSSIMTQYATMPKIWLTLLQHENFDYHSEFFFDKCFWQAWLFLFLINENSINRLLQHIKSGHASF